MTTAPPTTVGPTTEPPCIWNDDMTGADGFMPDSGYWEVVQESPQVVSNALRVDMPSGPAAVTDIAQSTFWLGDGDFDIVIDFLNFSISNLGGAQRIRIQDPTNTYWAYLQRGRNASGQFIQGRTYNTIDSTYNVSPASGQFRFTRVGNAVRCYADYGSGMTQIREDLSFNYTGPMKIVFSGWHYSNNPAVTIDWDNFVVNVGCDAINETTAPPTTLAPTTVAPTTEPPTSVVGTTALPSSLPPTTSPPTTVVPSTLPVSTTPPTTVAVPTTLAPTTLVPTTEPPFICTHPEYSLVTDEGTLYSLITDEGTLISIIC